MKIQKVYSDGIYHGLPVFDDTITGLRAMVVGASGMSGQSMIDVLKQQPKRWEKIYALSRRPPQLDQQMSNVQHVPTDFLKEPTEIAKTLKDHHVQA